MLVVGFATMRRLDSEEASCAASAAVGKTLSTPVLTPRGLRSRRGGVPVAGRAPEGLDSSETPGQQHRRLLLTIDLEEVRARALRHPPGTGDLDVAYLPWSQVGFGAPRGN